MIAEIYEEFVKRRVPQAVLEVKPVGEHPNRRTICRVIVTTSTEGWVVVLNLNHDTRGGWSSTEAEAWYEASRYCTVRGWGVSRVLGGNPEPPTGAVAVPWKAGQ